MSGYYHSHKLTDEKRLPAVYDEMIDLLDAVMSNKILQRADFEK